MLTVVVLISSLTTSVSTPSSAVAEEGPDSVVQQQWELLGERRTGLLGPTTIPVHRGTLPGGTTKFDPAPTATFVLVAKVSPGLGHWEVQLRDQTGAAMAEIILSAATSQYQIFTAPVTWSSADRELATIYANRGGTKTLDIQKAYLKLEQSGTIKKTVARMPMATRQHLSATGSWFDWQDLSDPIFYRHLAQEFSPSPTVTLRTAGRSGSECTQLGVRLVDNEGTSLWQTEHPGTAWTTNTTGPVQLADGKTYRVQVRLIPECFGTLLHTADILNADLIFEQSTEDEDGIVRTVSFYPSISSPIETPMGGSSLAFLLEAPSNDALAQVGSFDVSMKRTDGQGDVGVNLTTVTTGDPLATAVSSSSSWIHVDTPVPTLPGGGTALDTSTIVAAGTTGRISQTVLRVAMVLRVIPPQYDCRAEPAGSYDGFHSEAASCTFEYGAGPLFVEGDVWTADPTSHYEITVQILQGNSVLLECHGGRLMLDELWEESCRADLPTPELEHGAPLSCQAEIVIWVGEMWLGPYNAPFACGMRGVDFVIEPNVFRPNGDADRDTVSILGSISLASLGSAWEIEITDIEGVAVRTVSGDGLEFEFIWNGKDDHEEPLPDGIYTITAKAGPQTYHSSVRIETPAFYVRAIIPGRGQNVAYSETPLLAHIVDPHQSIEPTLITFDLTTLGEDVLQVFSGSDVSYDPTTGWAKVENVELEAGSLYTLKVSAEDGNGAVSYLSLEEDLAFMAISSPVTDESHVTIKARGIDSGDPGQEPGTTVWSFIPEIQVGDTAVSLPDGSQHPGWGIAENRIGISDAIVMVEIEGHWEEAEVAPYPAGAEIAFYRNFLYIDASGLSQTIEVPAGSGLLEEIEAELPATASDARLELDLPTEPTLLPTLCADPVFVDPAIGERGCSADPLRFHITEALALRASEAIAIANEETAELIAQAEVGPTYTYRAFSSFFIGGYDPIGLVQYQATQDPSYLVHEIINPLDLAQCAPIDVDGGTIQRCFKEGVAYSGNAPFGGSDVSMLCLETTACTYSGHQQTQHYRCVNQQNGRNRFIQSSAPQENAKGCSQTYLGAVRIVGPFKAYTATGREYSVQHIWLSDFGHGGDNPLRDELSISLSAKNESTQRGWVHLDSGAKYWGTPYPYNGSGPARSMENGCLPEKFHPTGLIGDVDRSFWWFGSLGTGKKTSPLKGWRQWQQVTGSGCVAPYYYRANQAWVGGTLQLDGPHENPMRSGDAVFGYGHAQKNLNNWSVLWDAVCLLFVRGLGGQWVCGIGSIGFAYDSQHSNEVESRVTRYNIVARDSYAF